MPTIQRKIQRQMNGIEISVYEVDLNDQNQIDKLKTALTAKVKKIKAHQNLSQYSAYTNVPNLKPEYVSKINETIQSITNPVPHGRPWLDVKRARVTEFMAELLLEKEFNCVFIEEANKRMNIYPSELYNQTSGIDVPGIQNTNDGLKFVVCEVKAAGDSGIPSSSSAELLKDINSSYTDKKDRLSREILSYFHKLAGLNVEYRLVSDAISFLCGLLAKTKTKEVMLKSVIFFPFLIRNNARILSENNLNDYRDFKKQDFPDANIQGLIWLFNQDITNFCNTLYAEAINEQHD